MIIGPDNVDIARVGPSCLVNGNPGLVAEYLLRLRSKDTYRVGKGFAVVGRFQYRDAAFLSVYVQDICIDFMMWAKSEAWIRGACVSAKAGEYTFICPRTATVE